MVEETAPAVEPVVTEETPPSEASSPIEEPIITEVPATTEPVIIPEVIIEETATVEPEIEILQTILSQVLGKIYPKTPSDVPEVQPLAHEYIYINQTKLTTDAQGYFDNEEQNWYSLFLEGPYVTVIDDDATVNADVTDQTPEDPFTWDENSASLAAINAFYHSNKIRDWFSVNMLYDMNVPIPTTVNSQLVDDYMGGCGAWFNNSLKTIEIGRGGYEGERNGIFSPCANDLNYALSSDLVYHEYTHYIIEDITHLPNIAGAESAAMAEGLSDYYAASINDDSIWGDGVSTQTRNLDNTLKYKYISGNTVPDENGILIPQEGSDMTGESHYDGQIFSGSLWDLRKAIGAEATDKLVFNTLFQDRLHFETFMYGMIIEDDDNNDFSDGTPHLIAILEAFENHGIGPGVLNFSGLPIDPAEWTKILQEAGYEGEEDPIYEAYSGAGCHANLPAAGDLSVYAGTCTIDSATTVTGNVYVYLNGTRGVLQVTGGSLNMGGNFYVGSASGLSNHCAVIIARQ